MKKIIISSIFLLVLIFAGCGKDDKPTNGNGEETGPPRLVVDTAVTKPAFTDVNEAVWSNLDSTATVEIPVGVNTLYGRNSNLGTDTVIVQAIIASDTLYIRAKWHDVSANIWGGYLKKSSYSTSWTAATYHGDDRFMMIFGKTI